MTDRAYHRTGATAARAILRDGFKDVEGNWGTPSEHRGVWVTWGRPWDQGVTMIPPDVADGALLAVDMPEGAFAEFEWVQPGLGYREALVPASVLDRYVAWAAWECDECGCVASERAAGWTRRRTEPFGVVVTTCPEHPDDGST